MKRRLVGILGIFVLLTALSPMASASSFLSLSNGAQTVSCNNSTAAGVTACGVAGFTTSQGSPIISFNGGNIGGYNVTGAVLQGNQPGLSSGAFNLDSATSANNVAAGTTPLVITFASSDFSLPTGTPLSLSASQSGTFTVAAAGDKQSFTAYGNAANGLAVGVGVADPTQDCINPAPAPPNVQACNATGTPTLFDRNGNFALNGVETITLAQGDTANFTTTTAAATLPLTASCVAQITGQVNSAYDAFIVASGAIAPYTFVVSSGSLPPGLTLNPNTGEISGTPTTPGTFSFQVTVTDSGGASAQTVTTPNCGITILPPGLTAACVAQTAGTVGAPYSSFIQVTGGTPPYTFSLNSGVLPPGLNLNPTTGEISGTPTTAGAFSFTVKVTDSSGTVLTSITPNCAINVGSGKSFKIGPSSMEGAIKISNGDWVNGGYSFSFKSNTHIETNYTVGAYVTITGPCTNGGTDTVTIPLGTVTYDVPAGNTNWLPTGDANSVLSWQGSVQVGSTTAPICGGTGQLNASQGAVFHTTVSQNPPTGSLVSWRFKYRDPAAKGKPNTNCLDTSDPNRARADVCGASWSQTVVDP